MASQWGHRVEEDLTKNPFLSSLQRNFEGLYRRAIETGEALLVVPCAECLDLTATPMDQVFAETHVLQASPFPGCYLNLCGQGVEVQESQLYTDLGFAEPRTCDLLQTESMYDFGQHIQVLVTDRPLIGRYRPVERRQPPPKSSSSATSAAAAASATAVGSSGLSLPRLPGPADQPLEWLDSAPEIQGAHFDEVARFRNTFVQVPGCEQSTAERIREIVAETVHKLTKHHGLDQPSQQRQLEYQVSRNTYAALHSWIWRHLQHILTKQEERLSKGIQAFASVEDLVEAIPDAQGRGLASLDLRSPCELLDEVDHKITPHEKVGCIDEAYSALQKCVADEVKRSEQGRGSAIEITGDDVMSLFILTLYQSSFRDRLAHIAHVEMYLQGAAGLSGSNAVARFEEAGYAVSALQAAAQFFLEEKRPTANVSLAAGASASGTSTVGGQGSRSSGGGFADRSAVGRSDEAEFQRAGLQLSGLVRQARADQQHGQGPATAWR